MSIKTLHKYCETIRILCSAGDESRTHIIMNIFSTPFCLLLKTSKKTIFDFDRISYAHHRYPNYVE